jgi:hypothetical protein
MRLQFGYQAHLMVTIAVFIANAEKMKGKQ